MVSVLAKRVVSSAKRLVKSLEHVGKSFIKIRKSRGPRMEPCGTPRRIFNKLLEAPLSVTYYILPFQHAADNESKRLSRQRNNK
jgi:hypothetical protein